MLHNLAISEFSLSYSCIETKEITKWVKAIPKEITMRKFMIDCLTIYLILDLQK